MENNECVWISQISTRHAQRIVSRYLKLINRLTQSQVMAYSTSWMRSRVITKYFEQDEEHTAFIINIGLYCYKVMPFSLKNVGAIYQKLFNRIFKPLIWKTMEVYVSDMITKSKDPTEHTIYLKETFELLKKYIMKFNPEKCVFKVSLGKFLGFISHRRIKANPEISDQS